MSIHVAITPEEVIRLNELHVYLTCPGCIIPRQKCPYPGANTLPIHERCLLYKAVESRSPELEQGQMNATKKRIVVLREANK